MGSSGIDEILAEHSDEVAALTRELRATILHAQPQLIEHVYAGWHGLGFHHPAAGYVGALLPRNGEVILGFEHGAELPDPHGLLEGRGRRLRYMRFVPAGPSPSHEQLVEYVDWAVDR
jgi:hypothetical protein